MHIVKEIKFGKNLNGKYQIGLVLIKINIFINSIFEVVVYYMVHTLGLQLLVQIP